MSRVSEMSLFPPVESSRHEVQ